MRLMVMHLGGRKPGPGQLPAWVRDQSRLRLAPTRPGSYIAELTQERPPGPQEAKRNHGEEAIAALGEWDGRDDSTLPRQVTKCLYETAAALSPPTELWLGAGAKHKRVKVKRFRDAVSNLVDVRTEEALLQGWLDEVNWDKGTAQLRDYEGEHVRLRFDSSLGDDMLRLATQYVEVRGDGTFSQRGDWNTVYVSELRETQSWRKPFDLDAFLSDPDAKVFDPDETVTIELTEDEWESFNRAILEGREV